MKVTWKANVMIGILPGSSIQEEVLVEAEKNDRDAAREAVIKEVYRSRIYTNKSMSIQRLQMI